MKVEIDVDQVLPCAVEILANAGDSVLVLNGTVIGVVPAQGDGLAPAPARLPRTEYYTQDQIVNLFRTHGPISVKRLNWKLSHGPETRQEVKRVVGRLVRLGKLVKLNESRFGVYGVLGQG